ncbi:MAG: class II aldolase/adducin family protein [Deltaproteobacteria bacterium]|nr:class II aldolase/adducin family protein [Deltaproteobacteria bacterium]
MTAKARSSGAKVNPRARWPCTSLAYDERPDCLAVVHAHPPIAIAFTIANVSMARCVLPEVVLTLGTVPTVEYETTGTQTLANRIRPCVRTHDAHPHGPPRRRVPGHRLDGGLLPPGDAGAHRADHEDRS